MRSPLFKTLDGLEAAARVARALGGSVIELPKDFPLFFDLLHKKESRSPRAYHVALEDPADLAPLTTQDLPLIASGSAQEASDMAVLATLLAREIHAPVVHFFDRRRVGAEFAKIDVLEEDALHRFAASNPAPGTESPEAVFDRLCARLKELTGREYRAYEYLGAPEAERVAVTLGTEAVRDDLVRVRLWRPFDARRFLETFPSSVKSLAVAKVLHADVLSAIHQGIVGGWSWFVGLPPISPIDAPRDDGGASEDVFEAVILRADHRAEDAPSAVEGSVREMIEDLAGHSPSYFQAYTLTEGGKTAIHLRIGPRPLPQRGPISRPALTVVLEGSLLTASGAGLPDRSIDMGAVARRAGLGDLVGPVLTSCLLALVDTEKWLCLTQKRADEIVAEAVQDRWGDFSQDIVEAHRRAMDLARRELFAPEKADHLDPLADPLKAHRKETPGKRPALPPDLQTDYLGFRLRSPFIACVPGVQDLQEEGLRESLAAAPIGAVFFGPVAEEDLDREAWKAFEALHQGVHAAGFKARPPLERYVDLLRSWKESVEVPVVAGLSAVSEKNWLALAFALEQAGADAIEIFLRSPEEGGPADPLRIISLVGAALKIPLAVRLTPGLSRLSENLEDLSNAGAKGVTLFQQPTGDVIHPDFLEPREEILLTGPEVFRLALPQLAKIALRPGTLPLSAAAAGPISASGDLLIALLSGAGAVYVVPDPENLRRLESTLRQWMEAKGFASLGEIRGALERGQPRLSVVK